MKEYQVKVEGITKEEFRKLMNIAIPNCVYMAASCLYYKVSSKGWTASSTKHPDVPLISRSEWKTMLGIKDAVDMVVKSSNLITVTQANCVVGLKVVRGPNWPYDNQDGGAGNVGEVIKLAVSGPDWVQVKWPSGTAGGYNIARDELSIYQEFKTGIESHKSNTNEPIVSKINVSIQRGQRSPGTIILGRGKEARPCFKYYSNKKAISC